MCSRRPARNQPGETPQRRSMSIDTLLLDLANARAALNEAPARLDALIVPRAGRGVLSLFGPCRVIGKTTD
jgi:hypothetical protein